MKKVSLWAVSLLFCAQSAFASLIVTIPAEIDFVDLKDDLQAISNQNDAGYNIWNTVNNPNGVLKLEENAWYALSFEDIFGVESIDFNDPSFVLRFSFEFRSNGGTPEIGGFALLNSLTLQNSDSASAFNIRGTQDWGLNDFIIEEDGSTWHSFSINLNNYLSGSYKYIAFINDCDANSGCGGSDIRFRNATFDVPEPSSLAIFALGILGLASRRLKKQ